MQPMVAEVFEGDLCGSRSRRLLRKALRMTEMCMSKVRAAAAVSTHRKVKMDNMKMDRQTRVDPQMRMNCERERCKEGIGRMV